MKTTPTLTIQLHQLALDMDQDSYGDYATALLREAVERLNAQHKLLDRAADIIAYHAQQKPLTDDWLAAAKEIGIEPCPF